jgi:hypothetical protein
MGRRAGITYEQVKAVIDALRAEGAKPTIDRIWEALGKAGSKGTVHKFAKQCFSELEGTGDAPESLRLLPPEVQQVVLAFADQEAATARRKIADELLECRQEAASLADDNERLAADLDELRAQLAQAASDKAAAEGRATHLANELAAARDEIRNELAAAEQARTTLAKAELRLEFVGLVEEELRQARMECGVQREARIEAERVVAVLGSQQKEHEERVQDLKASMAVMRDAYARLETTSCQLAEILKREKRAREAAERKVAALAAVQVERPGTSPKSKRRVMRQGMLWQGDGLDGQVPTPEP